MWISLAIQDDTLDEHLWFGVDFTRMSQSAALEWIEMLRWSNIDRAPLRLWSETEITTSNSIYSFI